MKRRIVFVLVGVATCCLVFVWVGGSLFESKYQDDPGGGVVLEEGGVGSMIGQISAVDSDWKFVVVENLTQKKIRLGTPCQVLRKGEVICRGKVAASGSTSLLVDFSMEEEIALPGDDVYLVTLELK